MDIITEDIKDICIELEHEGFTTFIGDEMSSPHNIERFTDLNRYTNLYIIKRHNNMWSSFDYSGVREVCNHIIRYLGYKLVDIEYIDGTKDENGNYLSGNNGFKRAFGFLSFTI